MAESPNGSTGQRETTEAPAEAREVKPDVEWITLTLRDEADNVLFFKVKFTTPMLKIMKSYSSQTGKPLNSFKFVYEGKVLEESDTSAKADITGDAAEIDVVMTQVGGNGLQSI